MTAWCCGSTVVFAKPTENLQHMFTEFSTPDSTFTDFLQVRTYLIIIIIITDFYIAQYSNLRSHSLLFI